MVFINTDVLFWVFIAIVTGVVESATVSLVSIWFCFGAVVTAIVASFGVSMPIQWTVFILSSAIFMVFTRPVLKNKIKIPNTPTNADRIIGKTAIVTETIDAISGKGQIKVAGQVWSAKCDDESIIESDTLVKIKEIRGVYAIVEKEN